MLVSSLVVLGLKKKQTKVEALKSWKALSQEKDGGSGEERLRMKKMLEPKKMLKILSPRFFFEKPTFCFLVGSP